jgi:hypothetical protein
MRYCLTKPADAGKAEEIDASLLEAERAAAARIR